MKIRIKNKIEDRKDNFVYEIDDENGEKVEIDVAYLDTAIKILSIADKQMTIRYAKAFEKFVVNLKRATRYADKAETKLLDAPSVIHIRQSKAELEDYIALALKYDKKAQTTFLIHNGWYDNFPLIVEEIKEVLEDNFNYLKVENDLLYTANRIDVILDKYRKKQKQKTL